MFSSFSLHVCGLELLILYNNIARTCSILGDMDKALHYDKESYRVEKKEIVSSSFAKDDDHISDYCVLPKHVVSTLQNTLM